GGTVILDADAQIDGLAGKVTANGDEADGGTVLVTAGGLAEMSSVYARGLVGGTVAATAGAIAMKKVSVRGRTDAGSISLISTVDNVEVDLLDGHSIHNTGGQIDVDANGSVIIEEAELDGDIGGRLTVNAGGDGVLGNSIGDDFDVTGAPGGEIEVQVGGDL